ALDLDAEAIREVRGEGVQRLREVGALDGGDERDREGFGPFAVVGGVAAGRTAGEAEGEDRDGGRGEQGRAHGGHLSGGVVKGVCCAARAHATIWSARSASVSARMVTSAVLVAAVAPTR